MSRFSSLALVALCPLSSCVTGSHVNDTLLLKPHSTLSSLQGSYPDHAYMLKVNVGTDGPFAGLDEAERRAIAPACLDYALFQFPLSETFPTNFNSNAEYPSGYVNVTDAFWSLNYWLATWSSELFVGRHLETLYVWTGGREHCVQFFEITQAGELWINDYLLPDLTTLEIPLSIGVFRKAAID